MTYYICNFEYHDRPKIIARTLPGFNVDHRLYDVITGFDICYMNSLSLCMSFVTKLISFFSLSSTRILTTTTTTTTTRTTITIATVTLTTATVSLVTSNQVTISQVTISQVTISQVTISPVTISQVTSHPVTDTSKVTSQKSWSSRKSSPSPLPPCLENKERSLGNPLFGLLFIFGEWINNREAGQGCVDYENVYLFLTYIHETLSIITFLTWSKTPTNVSRLAASIDVQKNNNRKIY